MEGLEASRQRLETTLREVGQAHILRHWPQLDDAQKGDLLDDIEQVDWHSSAKLIEPYVRHRPQVELPQDIQPAKILPSPRSPSLAADLKRQYREARAVGAEAIRNGQVAAFTVAGGQGTRLGFDGPKGAYPISPVRNAPLFQLFAEYLLGTQRRFGRRISWYIMTSPSNHAATQAFFREHSNFGLAQDQVTFFPQSQMPAFLPDGRAAMSARNRLALSPDGHGGSLRALARNGCLQKMSQEGVEYISYFQVDNPLVHCIDPLFIGLHIQSESEMSSKAVEKSENRERVGNFCIADGKLQVIEYSDLPDSLADQKNPDGSRRFNAGSIAIHVLSRGLVERLTSTDSKVEFPWHRADKAQAVLDDSGNVVKPEKPNVVKLEMFVFDAIPLARNPIVLYTDRAEEFSPVKNAEGVDSAVTSRRDMVRRAAHWLDQCGVAVPRTAGEPTTAIEINPRFACDAQALSENWDARQLDWSRPVLIE